jgi:hypothetical protein
MIVKHTAGRGQKEKKITFNFARLKHLSVLMF